MLKKLLSFVIIIFTALFISACSDNERQMYVGKSDNWEVNYGREENFAIKYIGEESMPKTEINYIIVQGLRTTDGNSPLNSAGVMSIKRPFREQNDDTNIKVTINWEGYSEEFILESR
ncbi:hypothetical protein [Oceanobacillus sp. CF4.6]|uniref:hypothetical protein n=1 Tax=Oceanobacillus sp. CF4.6 TaxID=3373080 RepID=UPI003EE6682D